MENHWGGVGRKKGDKKRAGTLERPREPEKKNNFSQKKKPGREGGRRKIAKTVHTLKGTAFGENRGFLREQKKGLH